MFGMKQGWFCWTLEKYSVVWRLYYNEVWGLNIVNVGVNNSNILIAAVPVTCDVIGLFLAAASVALALAPVLVTLLGLYFQFDPIYTVIRELIFQYEKRETATRLIIEFCRVYLTSFYLVEGFRLVSLISLSFITAIDTIQNLCQLVNEKLEYYSCHNPLWVNIRWNLLCYNKLVLCVNVLQLVEIIALLLMGAGLIMLVLWNFIIIRMYDFFPFSIWCCFPVLDVIVIGVIQLTIPQCVTFANLAAKWKAHLILTADKRRSPYERKRTRAMYPLRVNVGIPGYINLFSFGKSTKVSYYGAILCHTINLTMAVR